MTKKAKWFVVATEGATTDGRTIQRVWIEQMAKNYDPKKYGARINLDHIHFWLYRKDEPHAQSYGDVLALKAEENADGKLQLFAQLDPTEDLIELNKQRQKIYTSVEIDPNFADSGEAYLVGLAVTDNPASLGTEMLKFAANAQQNPFAQRKFNAENVISEAVETALDFSESEPEKPSLFDKIKAMFSQKDRNDNQRFDDVDNAVLLLSDQVKEMTEKYTALLAVNLSLQTEMATLSQQNADFANKFAKLEQTPIADFSQRPVIAGEKTAEILTDC
ncbi:capsid scaffolding protein [Chelonobacter oris]|uniref:GPO family capsid scaffolding protein n=1 Tax=Chelonobacter oris TaxID=505317 RepID=UPI002449C7AD|nr:GPO family capsid scaffolding protein [Chelonobacter oris]MDH3000947.1 capsid scaffolding protein [Chelonobacter oris]